MSENGSINQPLLRSGGSLAESPGPKTKNLRIDVSVAEAVDVTFENKPSKEEELPYSFGNELYLFFNQGLPLMMSSVLEWGLPPMVAMVMAGHTERNQELQAALGFGRTFSNCSILMIACSLLTYFGNCVPACIGAGRKDRISSYFYRSICLASICLIPSFLIQFFSRPIMEAAGVDSEVAEDIGIFTRYNCFTWFLMLLEAHFEIAMVNLGYVKTCALNSLVTGCGVDIVGSYFFIYKKDLGVRGAAYTQWCVKASRLVFWAVAVAVSGEWRVILKRGPPSGNRRRSRSHMPPNDENVSGSDDLPSSPPALLRAISSPRAKCREPILPLSPRTLEHSCDPVKVGAVEELFSWTEWKIFARANFPTLALFFCG